MSNVIHIARVEINNAPGGGFAIEWIDRDGRRQTLGVVQCHRGAMKFAGPLAANFPTVTPGYRGLLIDRSGHRGAA